jgi:hypothetical protein
MCESPDGRDLHAAIAEVLQQALAQQEALLVAPTDAEQPQPLQHDSTDSQGRPAASNALMQDQLADLGPVLGLQGGWQPEEQTLLVSGGTLPASALAGSALAGSTQDAASSPSHESFTLPAPPPAAAAGKPQQLPAPQWQQEHHLSASKVLELSTSETEQANSHTLQPGASIDLENEDIYGNNDQEFYDHHIAAVFKGPPMIVRNESTSSNCSSFNSQMQSRHLLNGASFREGLLQLRAAFGTSNAAVAATTAAAAATGPPQVPSSSTGSVRRVHIRQSLQSRSASFTFGHTLRELQPGASHIAPRANSLPEHDLPAAGVMPAVQQTAVQLLGSGKQQQEQEQSTPANVSHATQEQLQQLLISELTKAGERDKGPQGQQQMMQPQHGKSFTFGCNLPQKSSFSLPNSSAAGQLPAPQISDAGAAAVRRNAHQLHRAPRQPLPAPAASAGCCPAVHGPQNSVSLVIPPGGYPPPHNSESPPPDNSKAPPVFAAGAGWRTAIINDPLCYATALSHGNTRTQQELLLQVILPVPWPNSCSSSTPLAYSRRLLLHLQVNFRAQQVYIRGTL